MTTVVPRLVTLKRSESCSTGRGSSEGNSPLFAQPAARIAASKTPAGRTNLGLALPRGLVDLHHELGAAHAHDRRGSADLHRLGRLLDHLVGHRGEASLAQKVAGRLLEKGVYVVGFFFPVVPRDKARIRTQVSAVHSRQDLDFALEKFGEIKKEFGL